MVEKAGNRHVDDFYVYARLEDRKVWLARNLNVQTILGAIKVPLKTQGRIRLDIATVIGSQKARHSRQKAAMRLCDRPQGPVWPVIAGSDVIVPSSTMVVLV